MSADGDARIFEFRPFPLPNDPLTVLEQIAFAGQPAVKGWQGPNSNNPSKQNQDCNYIFLNTESTGGLYQRRDGERASVTAYDGSYQGRAPAWSPDGATIAFESNRSGKGYAAYRGDLASGTITRVTNPALGAHHAKFFPDGKTLIRCINHPNQGPKSMGIAWGDISGLL
jgi:hypothetical protein